MTIAPIVIMMLLMLVGGIGLTQAISDPKQVTLRWLRLGGMICLPLIVVAATVIITRDGLTQHLYWIAAVGVSALIQLTAAQLGQRALQRVAAGLTFLVCSIAVCLFAIQTMLPQSEQAAETVSNQIALMLATPLDCGLLGGFLMAMLLGHAYLTAGGEMTQAPFTRLILMLALLLVLRGAVSTIFGLWPFLTDEELLYGRPSRLWPTVMVTARYLVGLIVPAVFTYMIYDCVKRRANQSATGILYVTNLLVIVGQGVGLSLIESIGLVF